MTAAAGSSGTPLPQKLWLKAGPRALSGVLCIALPAALLAVSACSSTPVSPHSDKPLVPVVATDVGLELAMADCWHGETKAFCLLGNGSMYGPPSLGVDPKWRATYRVSKGRFYAKAGAGSWAWAPPGALDCKISFEDSNHLALTECAGGLEDGRFERAKNIDWSKTGYVV